MLITYNKKDFAHALTSLLPTGRAWNRSPNSTQHKLMLALGRSFERSTILAVDLIDDVFPATSTETLSEWEKTVGLPSLCSGVPETLQGRREQVVSRLVGSGGQSINYYIGFAKALGRDIQIKQHAPFRAGVSRCGDHLGDTDWFFVWTIALNRFNPIYFRSGNSTAGEPLCSWGDRVFECEIRQIIPSHTILLSSYTD